MKAGGVILTMLISDRRVYTLLLVMFQGHGKNLQTAMGIPKV